LFEKGATVANNMNHHERLLSAFRGEPVDRTPISLWHHWPGTEDKAETLARAEVEQQEVYDFDFVKVTPMGLKAVEDLGVEVGPPYNDHGEPTIGRLGVNSLADWDQVAHLSATEGRLAQEVEALRLIGQGLEGRTPYFQTLFFPLTNAGKLAGPRVLDDLRQHPDVVGRALKVMTETAIEFARACLVEGGADGLFISTKYGDSSLCSAEEYKEFSMPYDLQLLEGVQDLQPLIILHLHGKNIMFDLFRNYPVDAINWHDRDGELSIAEAKSLFRQGLVAGLSNDTEYLMNGSVDDLVADVQDAVRQAEGRRLVVGPGCVLPTELPPDKLQAMRQAVEE
jgi:uroporphyrinogen decarboxylase